MKKKLLATITALSLAATCASALAACGDDGNKAMTVNETQWKTAINAAIDCNDFEAVYEVYDESQSTYLDEMRLFYKKADNAYLMDVATKDGFLNRYLHKKGDRYYGVEWLFGHAQCADLMTKAEFDNAVAQSVTIYDVIADNVLEQVRDNYSKFKSNGIDGGLSIDGTLIKHATYESKNFSFTMKSLKTIDTNGAPVYEDIAYTAELASVTVTENDTLYSMHFEGVLAVDEAQGKLKQGFYYSPVADIAYELDQDYIHMLYPEVLGQTFTLESVKVDTNDETFVEMASDMEQDYLNEEVTCAEDGKLSGDIIFDGKAISDFTLTDDYGDITVKGPGNLTLTGECYIEDDINKVALKLYLTVPTENGNVIFTFTFARY